MYERPARRISSIACARRFGARWVGRRGENINWSLVLGSSLVLVLGARNDVDSINDIALENLIDHFEAVQNLSEYGVFMIQTRVVHQVDEELRVAGIAAARGNADSAANVRPAPELVEHEGGVADVLVRAGTAALDHEVRDHSVKRQPIVVAGLGEPGEPENRRLRVGREEQEVEPPDAADGHAGARGRQTLEIGGVQI